MNQTRADILRSEHGGAVVKASFRSLVVTALLAVFVAGPAVALEKRVAKFQDNREDLWRGGPTSCSLVYYNTCTGWIWIWSGWTPEDRIGVSFTSCCAIGHTTGLGTTFVYFSSGAPSGYGFTGTIDVFDADGNGCPTGASIASQPFLPANAWNSVDFTGTNVPDRTFAITTTFGAGPANPAAIATDHPDAVDADPAACGFCYPLDRVNHSFYYGTPGSPLCPGSVLNDGVCDAQFIWDVAVSCTVGLEPTSWAGVKNLFR
jgi:hypothetical protein